MALADQHSRSLRFPPASMADEDGLVMIGGQLTIDWLLEAYRSGIFPWPFVDGRLEILSWWSPDPRAVVELDRLHVPRRLQRRMRKGEFQFTLDRAFAEVVEGCAGPRRGQRGTWITAAMRRAYQQLHEAGYAHSVEAWHDGQLVGGVYGVALGGFFSGESMFHRRRDASKAALVYLVGHLRKRGFQLFDVQQWSPHLGQLGATLIPRNRFLARLKEALEQPVSFLEPTPAH